MSDRKTFKIPRNGVVELLEHDKEPHETWEGYFLRLYEEAHNE